MVVSGISLHAQAVGRKERRMRLIDADLLIEILGVMQGLCDTKAALIQNSKIWQQAKDLPTVDAVPVIRCKDCAYYRPYSDGRYDCDNMLGMADAYEDGFCSRAERTEE